MRIIEVERTSECPHFIPDSIRENEAGEDEMFAECAMISGAECEVHSTIRGACECEDPFPEWCPLDKKEEPEITRLIAWFGDALGGADFDLRMKDKEKGDVWKENTPMELFESMKRHADIVARQLMNMDHHAVDVHSIKIANYALMIATRVDMIRKEADAEDGKTDTD